MGALSRPEPLPPVAGDGQVQSEVLESLAGARRYRAWLSSLADRWLGDDPIEIGSGTGDYAEEWATRTGRFTASEADETRLTELTRRFAGDGRVIVRPLRVPVTEHASYSAVVAYNVLEHIPDDVAALRAFRDLIGPTGHVIILVPAFNLAMSAFDREIGHERRYRKATLRAAVEEAGFEVLRLRYVNMIGLPMWILGMRVLGRRPRAGALLWLFDRCVVPLMSRVERVFDPPFGQSVLVVARPR